MKKNLLIVESPTKAKTIAKFLDKNWQVESSFGHLRDLPKSKMGIDIEHNFEPQYVIPTKTKKKVTELKKLADQADFIYYATDEDREGEAIAWHLDEILKHPKNTARISFHEITKDAVLEAVATPHTINQNLVNAQQARRILDRLVGYELSPFLWKKVARGLSAGRVQSVCVRLVVEREREIAAFNAEEYWTIEAIFDKDNNTIKATLYQTPTKVLKKFDINNQKDADQILAELTDQNFKISKIEQKETKRYPNPPFTTSTLQQTANRVLGFSAKQTMMLAQQLYEGMAIGSKGSIGLITYMRTDSLTLSDKFVAGAENYLVNKLGKEYFKATHYKTKSKLAQEAHEAIRPTDPALDPENVREYLNNNQFKLYKLIWQRAVASQMSAAKVHSTTVFIASDNEYIFKAKGQVITFPGWLAIIPTGAGEEILPELKEADSLKNISLEAKQHFTEPPARYSEAGLIKILEEYGIGRPSTYAPTIATIQVRKYVIKEEKRLKPTEIGILVNDLLVEHFNQIVDYEFTAKLEADLDDIALGDKEWQPIIKDFYMPFKDNLIKKDTEIDKKELTEETTDEKCDKCNSPMVIKLGRFGKFMACSNYPDCKNTKQLGDDGKPEEEEKIEEPCDKCGKPMVVKHGRFGKFIACSGYPDCKNIKNVENKTGVKCPECGKGEIVEKRSKAGKVFFACNQYPDCKHALWSKPTGDKCPECKSLLVFGPKDTVKCSTKECKYTK
ncbi:MAG: DNA topoisomerase I [Parcubacteria group bacterium CG1_02_37_51]|uniref:DNA topoisomerase 1 n=2 Tax=Candidatus Komeiliibacteriota TaxID=1817908 RepID=A0A2M8DS08_9BACT|nr:MAG: DNA topoisomerase I [Parcubacteria group bacterium CG1_02_37_51]PIY95007.1 MAG: type I DNA topoisomerase [Candidatus Komeilibacteria bacterium CG_4_10_14_0_8_um_filter_37_78]PJC02172.1 MAG: type I DNA topoisomerase [Candidatus Komeilibacteria bacterium CG_4_9_14_0_8_um_filter_36_9]